MPKGKKPNAHDKRHENGLAPPAKRVVKQKSSNSLHENYHANGFAHSATPALPSVAVDSPSGSHNQLHASPNGFAVPSTATNGTILDPEMGIAQSHAYDDASYHAFPLQHKLGHGKLHRASSASPLRIDVDADALKNAKAYKSNIITMAATVISSCPITDVITILILLLSLPTGVANCAHLLYAFLEFIRSGEVYYGGSITNSLPSVHDVFHSTPGKPSLLTIAVSDLASLGFYLVLWRPFQNLIVDFAPAVIAIYVGGAAAMDPGHRRTTMRSVLACFATILAFHMTKWRSTRQFGFQIPWTDNGTFRVPSLSFEVPEALWRHRSQFESFLGVHIVTQGIVRLIRRKLSQAREQQSLPSPHPTKKNDTEMIVPPITPRRNSGAVDIRIDGGTGSSSDGRPPGPYPSDGPREGERISTSKQQRRRQANYARSHQPFWAAIAGSKVSSLKAASEERLASLDASEAKSMEICHSDSTDVTLGTNMGTVWIGEVKSTEIDFWVLVSSAHLSDDDDDKDPPMTPNIDKTKPFYIRVNGADWTSTRIICEGAGDDEGDQGSVLWSGAIYGLTPMSSYNCEFISMYDRSLVYSVSLVTQSAPMTDLASMATAPQQPPLRPQSPTTTLKNSIAAADSKLNESRNKIKKNRKDHSKAQTGLRKEINDLTTRRAATTDDARTRQKVQQLQQNVQQARSAAESLEAQRKEMGDIPANVVKGHEQARKRWEEAQEQRSNTKRDLNLAQQERNKAKADQAAALDQTSQRRERLHARENKLKEQLAKAQAEKAQSTAERKRKTNVRLATAATRAQEEARWIEGIQGWEQKESDELQRTQGVMQEYRRLETHLLQQMHASQPPLTPEGPLPGTSGASPPPAPTFSAIPGPLPTTSGSGSFGSTRDAFASFQFPTSAPTYSLSPTSTGLPTSAFSSSLAPGFPHLAHDRPTPSPGAIGSGAYSLVPRDRSSSLASNISSFSDDLHEMYAHTSSPSPHPPAPSFYTSNPSTRPNSYIQTSASPSMWLSSNGPLQQHVNAWSGGPFGGFPSIALEGLGRARKGSKASQGSGGTGNKSQGRSSGSAGGGSGLAGSPLQTEAVLDENEDEDRDEGDEKKG
ncbi:hypothetical protein P152DRAFT_510830 [Eremomyces bilateralis CBS 781.70]|uniref:Ubiquitination network signaling protein n=1 Tax=Eremomyces bilateralis CBS 781.70 TaxID=1392243 RepID=A0A6G1GHU1_9PEZI|nr:uncharacterized protein P152DRAFT_510830 [Eremomyces bilateralis CBS 781.70]KAF1817648.1 hypothetical protein P152DRAFT_510830 [Eremomyces bilateralis CBS 781.70]